MSDITKIDKNFKVNTNINKEDIKFYDARVSPFRVYGVFYDDGKFRRMPEKIAKTVSSGVHSLHANTAGGRVRFKTNSPYVAINAKMTCITRMDHFPLCGSAGFDLYADGVYANTFRPPYDMTEGYESLIELGSAQMREITINLPLYSDVCELYIGLADDAKIDAPTPYRVEKPVVYYGSSVTQGGCASRPGTAYQSFICRELDVDFINLGFSGNARAEEEMYNYIKTLDMSAFVMDYDYNSPSIEHLTSTHEKMFLAIREAQPNLPIVMLSAPIAALNEEYTARREIIKTTYTNALARGDKNVHFIDGPTLMAICGTDGTVDNVHPTDFGFFSMAQPIIKLLKEIL